MLSAVFLDSCAFALPPARIGNYVSSAHQAGDDAFTRSNQQPLQTGLVIVSDTAELVQLRIFRKRLLLASEKAYSGTWAVRFLWR